MDFRERGEALIIAEAAANMITEELKKWLHADGTYHATINLTCRDIIASVITDFDEKKRKREEK